MHYWTQPLPNPLSTVAHHLPPVLHRLACVGTLMIEIILPAVGALPLQFARAVACAGFVAINVAINLSGSYGMIGALSYTHADTYGHAHMHRCALGGGVSLAAG